MYFQLEVNCYSNEGNKNKWKLSINSINKKQFKDTWRVDCTGYLLAKTTYHTLLLGLKIKSAKYNFQVQVMFVWARSKSLNTVYVIENQYCCSQWWSPRLSFIIYKCGGITLLELVVASLRIYQIYVKINKVKIKPYIRQKPFHRLNFPICQLLQFTRAA